MSQPHEAAANPPRESGADALAAAVGCLITLAISGYQFGRGNHTVYLLEGLRLSNPELLARDWFVTSTLQYHALFSWFTALLMRVNLLEPGFLAGYLALVILWQAGWLRIVLLLRGDRLVYLLSVVLYFISAGGISLGVYQFLQDGCFLPSNVSSVAMLWGFYFWMADRRVAAASALAVAGLFHLNYALLALGAWSALLVVECALDGPARRRQIFSRRTIGATLVLVLPCALNIINALEVKFRESGSIPLDEFVRIYVRFRHTHHFDPLAWPIALWIAFLWPIPFAVLAWRWRWAQSDIARDALRQIARIFLLLLFLQIVAFFFAGVWYVSESLVQAIFWRFSVYVKLFASIGAAVFICQMLPPRWLMRIFLALPILVAIALAVGLLLPSEWRSTKLIHDHLIAIALFALLTFAPAAGLKLGVSSRAFSGAFAPSRRSLLGIGVCIATAVVLGPKLGVGMTPEKTDDDFLAVCRWARESTPRDAIFLVPPADTSFRLEAQRAIVVNFKHVPQLSGEIVQWMQRMTDVLGTNDVSAFPRDYSAMLAALDERYESRSPRELIGVARKYQARYIVVNHGWSDPQAATLAFVTGDRHYFVYQLNGD